MENPIRVWRLFFAIGLLGIAIQELVNSDFVLVMLPAGFPAWLSHRVIWDWIFSLVLAMACICMILEIKARAVALFTGGLLLLMVILFQIIGQQNAMHLGTWTNAFKELTLSGGAFLVAGSLAREDKVSALEHFLEKLIPAGKYFFAVTIAVFGYMHFIYLEFVAMLVPNWIPKHVFWAEFAGVALMAGGIGIIVNIKRHLAANLLGIAIFLWFIVLHIPRAIADPQSGNGNEITSVFEALSFTGIAFLIGRKKVKN